MAIYKNHSLISKIYKNSVAIESVYKNHVLIPLEELGNYLTFTNTGSNLTWIGIQSNGDPSFTIKVKHKLSSKSKWHSMTIYPHHGSAIVLNSGESVQFKGSNSRFGSSRNDYYCFYTSIYDPETTLKISGDIRTIIEGKNNPKETVINNDCQFINLFTGLNLVLTDCSELQLPYLTLSTACYAGMFYGCSKLKKAPALPATTLAMRCYDTMFAGCSALLSTPALPASTLKYSSYREMFLNCTSLTTVNEMSFTSFDMTGAPDMDYDVCRSMFENCSNLTNILSQLYPTTLVKNCYTRMFQSCTNLRTAPALPAETVENAAYYLMFYNCYNLNKITCGAKSLYNDATYNWVHNVSSNGEFYQIGTSSIWFRGDSGIPNNWSVWHIVI